jgi:hypothetical protein
MRYPGTASMTGAERNAKYRANSRDKYYQSRTKYRHNNSKWETDESYLARPFVAWDGEGVTRLTGNEHLYVLLAVKSSDGDGDYLANPEGMGTAQIFDFVLAFAERNPGAINVIYGGGYDFNMWLRDFTRNDLEAVYQKKYYTWKGYRIGWRKGKSFYLCRVNGNGEKLGKGIMIYDCVSFFQCTFVDACDSYLGESWHERAMIVKNKALRSTFDVSDIPNVRKYNDAELVNLIALMSELRDRLNKVGLRPRRWDGPGAVAAALLMREKIKEYEAVCPPGVAKAARYAYAGGRFELIRFGHVTKHRVYEADINSAYPAALRSVPNLAKGHWEHVIGDPGKQDFALYHIEYHAVETEPWQIGISRAQPFFHRRENGAVCWPQNAMGWYWSPEYNTGQAYIAMLGGTIKVHEAWVFHPSTDDKPFAFVDALYNKRRALKKAKDGAHVGIKLGLNSLYGKLCQQVGWELTKKGLRIPPFHQLEWAGFTTSYCRAEILRACLPQIESVIAFETDAVFTDKKLDLTYGTELGDYELTIFKTLTYIQSGVAFGELMDGTAIEKCRGIDKGSLLRSTVVRRMQGEEGYGPKGENDRQAPAMQTRFVGAGVALAQNFSRWRKWERQPRWIKCYPLGKRACPPSYLELEGKRRGSITTEKWYRTVCPFNDGYGENVLMEHSHEYPVEWINPNPAMDELIRDQREESAEQWQVTGSVRDERR